MGSDLTIFLAFGNKFDEIKHALDNSSLELIATLVSQDAAQEHKHTSLLARELQAQGANGLDDCDLELVGDIGHEARDLLHETVNTGLVSGLEQRGDGERGNGAVGVGDEGLDIGVAHVNDLWLE